MDNNELKAMEELLKPRCEFRASADLKDRIMAEANRQVAPRRARLWPWMAAACAVAALVVAIVVPVDRSEMAQATTPTPEKSVETAGKKHEKTVATADNSTKTEQRTTTKVMAAVDKKAKKAGNTVVAKPQNATESPTQATVNMELQPATDATIGQLAKADTQDHGKADTIAPAVNNTGIDAMAAAPTNQPQTISEIDMPITRPENLRYTPEEIALMRKQANEAYINWMKLELEIMNIEMESTARMIKEKK